MCKFGLIRASGKPSDIIPRDSISWDGLGNIRVDLTLLNIPFTTPPKPHWPPTPATKSMLPTFGAGHNNLFLEPTDAANHHILCNWLHKETLRDFQNIIVYYIPGKSQHIVHRVVKVREDDQGRYFKTKGDNIFTSDTYKIRDEHILYISAGIIF